MADARPLNRWLRDCTAGDGAGSPAAMAVVCKAGHPYALLPAYFNVDPSESDFLTREGERAFQDPDGSADAPRGEWRLRHFYAVQNVGAGFAPTDAAAAMRPLHKVELEHVETYRQIEEHCLDALGVDGLRTLREAIAQSPQRLLRLKDYRFAATPADRLGDALQKVEAKPWLVRLVGALLAWLKRSASAAVPAASTSGGVAAAAGDVARRSRIIAAVVAWLRLPAQPAADAGRGATGVGIAIAVALAAVVVAFALLGSPAGAPAQHHTGTAEARVASVMSSVTQADAVLSADLRRLSSGDVAAARTAVTRARAAAAQAAATLPSAVSPAERTLVAQAEHALAAQDAFLDAVLATLADSRSPQRSLVRGDARAAIAALRTIPGVRPAPATALDATTALLAWASSRLPAAPDRRPFLAQVDRILIDSASARAEVDEILVHPAEFGEAESAGHARHDLADVLAIRTGLLAQANALGVPSAAAERVQRALVATLQDSVAADRTMATCLDSVTGSKAVAACGSSGETQNPNALESKEAFRLAYDQFRSQLGAAPVVQGF